MNKLHQIRNPTSAIRNRIPAIHRVWITLWQLNHQPGGIEVNLCY